MILQCNFEEIRALASAAELIVADGQSASEGAIAAPPESVAQIELLMPRLTGDLTIETLADHRRVRDVVALICQNLRDRMDDKVLRFNPGHEEAVCLYFDYGHVLTLLDRLDHLGAEMGAMFELITGSPATPETEGSVTFPD